MYGEQSVPFAQQVIEIGEAYLNMGATKQAVPHLKNALKYLTNFISQTQKDASKGEESPDEEKPMGKVDDGRKLLPELLSTLGSCYIRMKMNKLAHVCLKECQRQNEILYGEDHESGKNDLQLY